MISLPKTIRNRATFRIMWMPAGNWTKESQPWQILPIPAVFVRGQNTIMEGTVAQGGYCLGSISRWCLPDEDRAEFYLDTGTINGVVVEPITDFNDTQIRIQVLDDEAFPTGYDALPTDGWKTVFAGCVINERRQHNPGLDNYGRITYYCAGILWRTRNWPLDRHSAARSDDSEIEANHAKGNPGYNVPLHGYFRKVLGNRSILDANDPYGDASDYTGYYKCHRMPLGGQNEDTQKWKDFEVVRHALISSRSEGEPIIEVDMSRGNFDGAFTWSVNPGDTCWDLLRRVCNRQRGRGSCFLLYDDDPSGNLYFKLVAYPSNVNEIQYFVPANPGYLDMNQVVSIPGAEKNVSAIDIDLNGDHRISEDGFQFENRQSAVFDAVVVQGERIQVLCNLNFFGGSLAEAWSRGTETSDEETFAAIPPGQTKIATSNRWKHVFRRYRFSNQFLVMPEPTASGDPINYYCDDRGNVAVSWDGARTGLNSTITVRVLPDLPIYEGYRYDGILPVRWDGGSDYTAPDRMQPVVMYKADAEVDGKLTWFPMTNAGWNIKTDDFGMYIYNPLEDQNGCRLLATKDRLPNWFKSFEEIGIKGVSTFGGFDLYKLNTIVGLELGTRVSITQSNLTPTPPDAYATAMRRMVMTVSGLHLWLIAPAAIWEFDVTRAGQAEYLPGLRTYDWGDKMPTISRDDRAELSFISALAFEYYGKPHNPGTWGLYDCGLMTEFQTETNGTIEYPTLGQIIGLVKYAGQQGDEYQQNLDTPITSIHYEHERGLTTWRTDYVSYDGNVQ